MSIDHNAIDRLSEGRSELERHVIDELVTDRISRRRLIQRGAALGLSLPLMAEVLAACGGANRTSTAMSTAPIKAGSTIRVAVVTPTGQINPLTVADTGGANMLAQSGEFLAYCDAQNVLRPMLATSWKPNRDATVWTFELRQGVTFHDGRPFTADDVVYTYKQQCDSKSGSTALSNFQGVLSPSGVEKAGPHTVRFHLDSANGNFPYLCSSDNYTMVVFADGSDPSKWQRSFPGTGPFVLDKFTPGEGVTFKPNTRWWGGQVLPAQVDWTFFASQEPQVLALQSGSVDVIDQVVHQGAEQILGKDYNVLSIKSSNHRQLSMRSDQAPFDDPRVRQAIALTLDRPGLVSALLSGYGQVGNDTPFAPVFRSSDTGVPQRKQDLAKAKQLLAAAGHPNGFKSKLYTEQLLEISPLAQVIKASVAKVGIDLALEVQTSSAYYGKSTYGQSNWLDGTMSLVDYGSRSTPDVFLQSPLQSDGPWNAARFHDSAYDELSRQYVATVDLQAQRRVAAQIERLLLDQTPIVVPYFLNQLTVTKKEVRGVFANTSGTVFLQRAGA